MHLIFFGWLPLIIPILLWLGACKMVNDPNSDIKPNIIIIFADDQGWGDLSLTGNPVIQTPNIDALAANGALFDRFYVNPVCSPTRAEMLTGRYHVRSGVFDTGAGGERLDLDETTFAEVLKKAGYSTAAFGKWHNGMQPPYHPNARGFDEYYGFCSGHWGNYFSPLLEHNGKLVKGQGFLVDDLTEKAMQFIEDHQENPFVVYLAYNTPHSPMQVPDQWWERYKRMDLKLDHRMAGEEDIQHTKAAYAMCENIDWNVGRIVEKVESLNLIEKTIVIYFSDNGPNGWRWNGDMKGRKGSTDEGGVRSPFMVQWKGVINPGIKVEEIAGAIDIFPSILDLANISHDTDQALDGISIKPYLFGEKPSHNERLLFSYWNKVCEVRIIDWITRVIYLI